MVFKEVILTVSNLGGCSGHERGDFEQFVLWEGVVVLKELILTISTLGRKWWFLKELILTVSSLERK